MRTMTVGSHGEDVRDVQARLSALGLRIDVEEVGIFGEGTVAAVRAFQQGRQLMVDGKVGPETWEELVEAGYTLGDRILYLRIPPFRGDDVRALQARLNLLGFDAGREDGIFGEQTDHAVREFQANVGMSTDGIVGTTTHAAMARLRPVGPGPGRAAVREGEVLRRLSASIVGSRIAVDAAHGPDDPGALGPAGTTEDAATWLLAAALAEELTVRGAVPILLRDAASTPSTHARARRANDAGAEILVALHMNSHKDPGASGASAYYFGRDDYVSRTGHRLAELILEEVTGRLGLEDCRTHPKSLPLLRETRMPAVYLEPCFLTNPNEEAKIRDLGFRRSFAGAVCDALEKYFRAAPEGADQGRPAAANEGAGSGAAAVSATADGRPASSSDGAPAGKPQR